MKQKEVEAVFGGKAEFENADRMASKSRGKKFSSFFCVLALQWEEWMLISMSCSTMPRGRLRWRPCVLLPTADSKCRRTDDYIFEGGCLSGRIPCMLRRVLTGSVVYYMWCSVERKLSRRVAPIAI